MSIKKHSNSILFFLIIVLILLGCESEKFTWGNDSYILKRVRYAKAVVDNNKVYKADKDQTYIEISYMKLSDGRNYLSLPPPPSIPLLRDKAGKLYKPLYIKSELTPTSTWEIPTEGEPYKNSLQVLTFGPIPKEPGDFKLIIENQVIDL